MYAIGQDRLVDETDLVTHTDQTISYGWVRFTAFDGSQLAVVGSGWQSEVSLWDVGSDPTPIGQDDPWRQVYDIAGVFDLRADENGFNGLFAVAGDKHVQLFDAQGEKRGQLRTSPATSGTGPPRWR